MANIVICSLGFRGHVNPILAIAKELVSRGQKVTYYCTEQFGVEISQTGANFCAYASTFDPKFEFPTINAASSYFLRTVAEARYVVPQLLKKIGDTSPDLVLYDGAFLAGRLLGELLQTPTIKLCPSYASTENYSPFAEGRNKFFQNSELVTAFDEEVVKLNTELGVHYDLRSNIGHAEAFNIVCMPREFHPNPSAFDDRFLFIGPSLRTESDQEFKLNNSGRPLLYISLGTLNNNKPDFYKKCFDAFASSEWDVMMSVGNRVDKSQWNIPPNFHVKSFFPQLHVLRQTKAFVTQGGMNSVQEALYFGVPLIVAPSTGEQELTAQRVNELGLGIGMSGEEPSAWELNKTVNEVALSSDIHKKVKDFSILSQDTGGYLLAAKKIEELCQTATSLEM